MYPLNRLLLYARTLRHLRPSQLAYLVERRISPRLKNIQPSDAIRPRSGARLTAGIRATGQTDSGLSFRFVNQSRSFKSGGIGWTSKDMPKLWRYNLHYFDYLQDTHRSMENKSHLISDWIQHNPPGTEDAWEPYTASLRIVNWVKFFLTLSPASIHTNPLENESTARRMDTGPKPEWLKSLYQQALWLEHNIEYHILANHYLKNGVALFFAGMYFEGANADRWIKKGLQILREELEEQFLTDGGHFERSPMYHSICVSDYLDVLNLAQSSQAAIDLAETDQFRQRVRVSLNFLSDICLPDSEIPLFNDAAFRIAPTPSQIFDYARRVIGYEPPVRPPGLAIYEQSASGYYVCRNGDDAIIIDCGQIGPDYQPGHAHCDTLSYELAITGRRVVVDSGVFDYEVSLERAYARSTKAHNTVVVDGEEQSEVWGVFRVARRARPIQACIEQQADGSVRFTGAHDGYARLTGKPIHKRSMSYDGQESWVIEDMLEGKGVHRMESYLHIHPDYQVVPSGSTLQVIEPSGSPIAIVETLEANHMRVEQGWYFPEFGVKRENHVIVFTCSGQIPLSLRYRIRKVTSQKQ